MRLQTKLQFLGLLIFFTVLLTGSLILKEDEENVEKTTHRSVQGVQFLPQTKHVTKSLAQLGRMDNVNKHLLFLNHVPKCGSEILILLLQKLQGFNNYRHVRLKGGNKRRLSNGQQENLVDEVYELMKKEAVPLSVDRHVFFIDFTSFDKQFPTYINLIRHPVDRVISRSSDKKLNSDYYYYKCLINSKNGCNFKTGQSYDLSIPYFCGHHPRCMILNNDWALEQAKNNVIKYFPVVGVLEELNATLEILEDKIPYFFKGARRVYEKDLLYLQTKRKKLKAPKSIVNRLEEALINEIDFYEWIKSRLFRQLKILYGDHNQH